MILINYTLTETITSGNVEVSNINGVMSLSIDRTYYISNDIKYAVNYCQEILTTPFNSVLIGGLGLGLLPYYINRSIGVTDIDVLENNSDVINVVNQMNYLGGNVNIIEADALTYTTVKKYDLILMDLWWFNDHILADNRATILSNYANNLNENGKFYFPLSKEVI